MTQGELDQRIERAANWFRQIPGVTAAVAELFLAEGLLSSRDLASLKPDKLAALAGITYKEAEAIILFAAERDKDNLG